MLRKMPHLINATLHYIHLLLRCCNVLINGMILVMFIQRRINMSRVCHTHISPAVVSSGKLDKGIIGEYILRELFFRAPQQFRGYWVLSGRLVTVLDDLPQILSIHLYGKKLCNSTIALKESD